MPQDRTRASEEGTDRTDTHGPPPRLGGGGASGSGHSHACRPNPASPRSSRCSCSPARPTLSSERRWRAAQLAGLQKIPAVIRELDSKSAAAIALIENIQREDLNPLEEAQAFLRLIEEFDLTHQQVADSVGRSRATVSNLLRLLDLAEPVKQQVNRGLLNMGHARALLALIRHDQVEIAKLVVNRGLSVRETEMLVKKTLAAETMTRTKAKVVDPDIKRLENSISEKLGAGVKIKSGKKGSGQLVISFHSTAELDGILEHLSL